MAWLVAWLLWSAASMGQPGVEAGGREAEQPLRIHVGGPGADELPWLRWTDDGPIGHEPDLARALAAELGRPLVWVGTEAVPDGAGYDPRLALIESGAADVSVLAVTVTEARAERVAFSEPYFVSGLCVVVAEGSPIRGPVDAEGFAATLAGRRVHVNRHTTAHDWLVRHAPDAVAITTGTDVEPTRYKTWFAALAGGAVDAIVTDRTHAGPRVAEVDGLIVLDGLLNEERIAVAVDPEPGCWLVVKN